MSTIDRRDWLSSVCPCEWQDVSTPKVCFENVHRVLEIECNQTNLIASSMTTWWKCSHSSIRRDFSWSPSRIWLRCTRSCSFHQIWQLTGLRSGLLAGYRAGVMKSGVSWVNRCTISRALWAGSLSAWLQYVTLYWKLKYFVVSIWILITRVINNIFLWNLAFLSQIYS